jgi:adenosylcobinamide-GDP ribazoletransferase
VTFLRQYLIAVHLFTRLPLTGTMAQWAGIGPDALRSSAAHFPGVGLLVGLVACTVFALLGLALPDSPYAPLVAAAGCVIGTVLLTGGSHEKGLAETADSLGGDVRLDRTMEGAKDGRFGVNGTLAVVLVLMARVSLLALLAGESPTAVLIALLAAHVLSRFWPLWLIRALPYLGSSSGPDGELLADRIDTRGLGIAAAWCAVPLALAGFAQGPEFLIMAVLASGAVMFWMRRMIARRLQGFDGASLGATQQACELACYLGAAIGLGLA